MGFSPFKIMRKIWQYSHLFVAFFIFAYLLIASVSGAILGIYQAMNSDSGSEEITLAQVINTTSKSYAELISLKNQDGHLELQAYDEDYNELKGNLDFKTGKITDKRIQKSKFILDTESFHRSLFLDETGRILVGIFTFLFLIELITGLLLMLKKVPKFSHLFTKWSYGSFALTYHHSISRLVFIPLLLIAITGVYLSSYRFKLIKDNPSSVQKFELKKSSKKELQEFPKVKETKVKDLVSLDFPFDESENYHLETKKGKFELDYNSGEVVKQELFNNSKQFQNLSFDIHTGKISSVWAWLISLVSLTIPGFIISGFMLFAKKRNKKAKGNSTPEQAEIVILYGSENGTTREQALVYFQQLLHTGKSVFLGTLNEITDFKKAKNLFILTSTYGNGEAPSNANHFLKKIKKSNFNANIKIGILGFGSKNYEKYNQFSKDIFSQFINIGINKKDIIFEKVNNKNTDNILVFEQLIEQKFSLKINHKTSKKLSSKKVYQKFKIIEKTEISEKNKYCKIILNAAENEFESGDLLRVKIPNTEEFRYYSISKIDNKIHLFCKYLEGGKCSEYWKNLDKDNEIEAWIEANPNFYFEQKSTIFICNGTGLAPFLGMIENNEKQHITLYSGFRFKEKLVSNLYQTINQKLENNQISELNWGYSQEENGRRITEILEQKSNEILEHLLNDNIIMICGALALKQEVENIIKNELLKQNLEITLEDFYLKKLLKADCY